MKKAVSYTHLAQNSGRTSWTFDEVDAKLYDIMKGIYENAAAAAKEFGQEMCIRDSLETGSEIRCGL